jgi:hypothetical protein
MWSLRSIYSIVPAVTNTPEDKYVLQRGCVAMAMMNSRMTSSRTILLLGNIIRWEFYSNYDYLAQSVGRESMQVSRMHPYIHVSYENVNGICLNLILTIYMR